MKYTEKTLAEMFNVDPNDYLHAHISELRLGARAHNSLMCAHKPYVSDILKMSPYDFKSVRNMGAKTMEEIIAAVRDFVSSQREPKISLPLIDRLPESLKTTFENVLNNTGEGLFYTEIQNIVTITGYQDRFNDHYSKLSGLSRCKLLPYIYVFEMSHTGLEKLKPYLEESPDIAISELYSIWQSLSMNSSSYSLREEIVTFLEWLDNKYESLLADALQTIKNAIDKNAYEVLRLRAEEETFDRIAEKTGYGKTRENIRQIEAKGLRQFDTAYEKSDNDLLLCISALKGTTTVTYTVFSECCGSDSGIFWYCIKKRKKISRYYYSEALDALLPITGQQKPSHSADHEKLIKSFTKAHPYLHKDEFENTVSVLVSQYPEIKDILKALIESKYTLDAQFYRSAYLKVEFMCEYVLKKCFVKGYKTNRDADECRVYMKELFGENAGEHSDRAIDARMEIIGCLIGRGTYIHPDYLNFDDETIKIIQSYIEGSTEKKISFEKIFSILKEDIAGKGITDRYILQGVIKKYTKFKTTRDYVLK